VQRLDANHFSDEYDQSPMPYTIFFDQGLAIHGTYQGGLGRPAPQVASAWRFRMRECSIPGPNNMGLRLHALPSGCSIEPGNRSASKVLSRSALAGLPPTRGRLNLRWLSGFAAGMLTWEGF
jgi:hypothetical protein